MEKRQKFSHIKRDSKKKLKIPVIILGCDAVFYNSLGYKLSRPVLEMVKAFFLIFVSSWWQLLLILCPLTCSGRTLAAALAFTLLYQR